MKYINGLIIFVLLSFPALAQQKQDYKCYLETTNGFEIGMYAWNVKGHKRQIAKLVGKSTNSRQKLKSYIKKVEECVFFRETFASTSAQELDKKTLK